MSITYEEALGTLEAMFCDGGWNRDQLDTVLRHEKGHMENTVDLILQHGTKDPDILINQLDSGIDPQQSIMALDEQLARTLSQQSSIRQPQTQRPSSSSSAQRPTSQPQGIGTFTVLPEDFLCIPNYRSNAYNVNDDEALARMLQDELFTEELRRNPDFAHLAGSNSQSASNAQRALRQGATNHSSSVNNSGNSLSNPFANFSTRFNGTTNSATNNNNANNNNALMENLKEMGEGAKRRLQIMASQFQQAQAAATAKITGNQNHNDPPAVAAASERRGLLDDNDDMELAARKDL